MQNDLSKKVVIVNLTVNRLSKFKTDKDITNKVISDYKSAKDSGNFRKRLFSKDNPWLNDIDRVYQEMYTYHAENTLSWGNGIRIIPISKLKEYLATINNFKAEFTEYVEKFILFYDNMINTRKLELNGMFNSADYLSQDEIKEKFNIDVEILDFSNNFNDIRLEIDSSVLNHLEYQAKEKMEKRLNDNLNDCISTINNLSINFLNRLKSLDNSEKGKHFKSAFLDNMKKDINNLISLDIFNDSVYSEKLKKIISDLEKIQNVEEFKSAEKRKEIINKANDWTI
jgi:hypothetical protein